MFHKHCSDESLVAHLDGELPFYRRAIVRNHVAKCWQCRLRLSEIEKQVLAVTRAMEEDVFPGPERIAAARMAFQDQAGRIASEVFAARRRSRVPRLRLAWAPVCAVAMLGVFWAWKTSRTAPTATVTTTIQRVEVAEAQAARTQTHQRFRVVARQVRPAPIDRESRLEFWSDPERGRFATRFNDSRGILRHAVWQPEPSRQYVYDSARSSTILRLSRQEARARWESVLFRDGLTLEQLEAGLLEWLENRPWKPVSLSSGFAALAAADGSMATVERMKTNSDGGTLLLRARRTSGGVTVEFAMEVDARTYASRLQSIRYESPVRVLELSLYSEPAPMTAAVSFEPPEQLGLTPLALPGTSPARTAATASEQDIASLDVEVHYALHRMRACLGETIEVDHLGNGKLCVRGVVVDARRKEELEAGLSPLAGALLTIDIKSVQETLRDLAPATLRHEAPADAGRAAGHALTGRALARFFPRTDGEVEEFAGRVASEGENVMKDAQALRYLAQRFGAGSQIRSQQASWLLQVMSYDHIRDLEAKVESTRQLMLPVFTASGHIPAPRLEVLPDLARGWNAELLRIFERSKNLNDRLRAMLAATDGADQQIRDVTGALAPLESSLQAASARAQAAHTVTQPF